MDQFARFSRLAAALCLSTVIVGFSAAQNKVIPKSRTFKTGVAVVEHTSKFSPQIAIPGPARYRPENPLEMGQRKGPANSLTVGKTLLDPIGSPLKHFPGISATGWSPPDTDFSVGPNHVVEVVNSSIAFFRKSDGFKTFQQDFGQFFAGVGVESDFLFDPKAFYDSTTNRHFVLCEEQDTATKLSKLLIAVSDDSDPTGNWFKYRIEAKATIGGTETWLDYPGFAANKDMLLMTGNMFGFENGAFGVQFLVVPKAPLLTGGSATVTTFLDGDAFTAQTARTSDAVIDKLYTVGTYNNTQFKIHAIGGTPTAPTLTSTLLSIPGFTYPTSSVAGPQGRNIDALDARVFTVAYRGGSLYAAHAVQASASDPKKVSRFYEINTRGWPVSSLQPTLTQSGSVVGAAGESYSMPAINVNKFGTISMLMTRTSGTIMADLVYSARRKSDPLGTIGAPVLLARSGGIFSFAGTSRWGDYAAVAIDPNDDSTFWGISETVGGNGDWTTDINSWRINDLTIATQFFGTLPTFMQGNFVQGSAVSTRQIDGNLFVSKSKAVAGMGQVMTWESTYQTTLQPFTTEFLAIKAAASGPTNATMFIFAFNWQTGNYDSIFTKGMKTAIDVTYEVPSANFSKYMSSDGRVKLAVRTVRPIRNNTMPASYQVKVDELKILGIKKQ